MPSEDVEYLEMAVENLRHEVDQLQRKIRDLGDRLEQLEKGR